jgi:DNA integrity scanning protein DisA with diadenylate cyclase activity/mannitol/fructose-specific phosphotransferase system IIA component (Ntr-type)
LRGAAKLGHHARMTIADFLTADRVVFLSATDKHEAVDELVGAVCSRVPGLDRETIRRRVFEREDALSSRMTEGIAMPHAVIDSMASTVAAIGLSRKGIRWDTNREELVHLVVLLVGSRDQHLDVLQEIATRLRDPVLYERIVDAGSPGDIYNLLTLPVSRKRAGVVYEREDLSRLTFAHALSIARQFSRARVVAHADAIPDADYVYDIAAGSGALVVSGTQNKFSPAHEKDMSIVEIPFRGLRRSTQVHFALLFLISQRHIDRDDLIVNVFGRPDSGFFDSIRLTHVKSEFDLPISFEQGQLGSQIDRHVLTRVLQLAGDLAVEGREGKPVGALFVVGDYEAVRGHTQQLIINPFQGIPDEDRNLLDPSLEETVKEFSKIDGAFLIRGDGVIMSAGAFLSGDAPAQEMQSGLGARHAAALGITSRTRALSVVISESTRRISVFHAGRRIIFT